MCDIENPNVFPELPGGNAVLCDGITLRDLFAGLIAVGVGAKEPLGHEPFARHCYERADALLKYRAENQWGE